jgi:hypothetical protein
MTFTETELEAVPCGSGPLEVDAGTLGAEVGAPTRWVSRSTRNSGEHIWRRLRGEDTFGLTVRLEDMGKVRAAGPDLGSGSLVGGGLWA